jgi:hypothetical protein
VLGRDAVELDEVGLRALRDRDDAFGRTGRPRHYAPEDEAVLRGHRGRVPLEGEVVNRHHGWAGAADGERVLRVHERRPDSAQQPRQRQEHAELLRRRVQGQRLDPERHEPGSPRRRRHANPGVRREVPELAQEVQHVGLVARAAAPEHVGVNDDQRRGHASARR